MKKIKGYFIKVVTILVTLSILLSFSTISAFADVSDEEALTQPVENSQLSITVENGESVPVIESGEIIRSENRTLTAVFDKTKILKNEEIKVTFDKTDVKNYYYESDGVTIVDTPGSEMTFEILSVESELGKVDFYADYGDGELVKSSIYTYSDGDVVYVSDISQDQAWYDCMAEKYDKGLLSLEEFQDEYDDFTRQYCVCEDDDTNLSIETDRIILENEQNTVTTTSETEEKITVSGRISWDTSGSVNLLPMRQTKIELRDDQLVGSRLIATTYTDTNGEFYFEIDGTSEWYYLENDGLDLFIRWYTTSSTFEVGADWAFHEYSFTSNIQENISPGSSISFYRYSTYNVNMSGCKAVYIQQGMVLAQRFALSMGMNTNNFIHVAYPGSDITIDLNNDGNPDILDLSIADSAFCWGNVANNCFSAIGLNKWNDIDTITHEYGHFVENSIGTYGLTLMDFIIYKAEHTGVEEMFTEKGNKAFAMELVWSEAWATAFSQIAQEIYSSDYSGLQNIADRYYEGFDLENETPGVNSSEFQEIAVTAFLYDLYDGGAVETFDTISLSPQNWWNYTTRANTKNLTDFMNVIDSYYFSIRSQIGAIMSNYGISPDLFVVTNYMGVSEMKPPELTWFPGGSSAHPNNMFEIVFYDALGYLIAKAPAFTKNVGYNDRINYTVPSDVWEDVLLNTNIIGNESVVNISVKTYRVDNITSGPYYSSHINLVFDRNITMNISSRNRYTERVVNIPQGKYRDICVTFETGGVNIIQTFGTKDTFIYLYNVQGQLLKTNMDSGYGDNSLFSYNFASDTFYIIRLEFFMIGEQGDTRLAITPSADSFTRYEAFDNVTNFGSFYSGSTLYYDSMIFTYTSNTTETVTFTTDASFDTYLYVIDPTSVELISTVPGSDSMYNDDGGGNRNARIQKNISANIDYLIIATAYNPSSASGNITVHFE